MAPRRVLTEEQERALAERYISTQLPVSALAKELNRSHKCVKEALLRQGCEMREIRDIKAQSEARRRANKVPHPNWRGGRVVNEGGYVLVALEDSDPMFSMVKSSRQSLLGRRGYVFEHRLVMARALGRPLARSETVHHINGNPGDNRLDNLQLRRGKHGNGHAFECADCGSHNIVASSI